MTIPTNSLPYSNVAGPNHLPSPITEPTVTTPPSCSVVGPIHLLPGAPNLQLLDHPGMLFNHFIFLQNPFVLFMAASLLQIVLENAALTVVRKPKEDDLIALTNHVFVKHGGMK